MRGVNKMGTAVLGLSLVLVLGGCDEAAAPDTEGSEEAAQQASASVEATVDLSGHWVLNEEESERPDVGAGRNGSLPSGGRRTGSPTPPARGEGPLGQRTLNIKQGQGQVTFTHEDGRSITLITDGVPRTREGERGTLQVRATWEADGLIVETMGPRGALTRTYALAEESDQLLVTSRLEGGPMGRSVEFTRVFDRAGSG